MTYALTEVETAVRKAARGAGYHWGMADDAARATRWLCAAGLDGVGAVAALLSRVDGQDRAGLAPATLGGDWRGLSGALCPIAAGTALSDSAPFWADDGKRMADVILPLLLLPFAASAARRLVTPVCVEWDRMRAVTNGHSTGLVSDDRAMTMATAGELRVHISGAEEPPLPTKARAAPSQADWALLNRFARRTYAPETEESRLKGAGAGLSDND